MEKIGVLIKGFYRDILKGLDSNVIYDSGWKCNTIVNGCRVLLSAFMRNEEASGIQFLKVGQGKKEWDIEGIPEIDAAKTDDLVTPYSVVIEDLDMDYLNERDEVVGDEITNRLQITAILKPGYPPPMENINSYPLREFGLFCKLKDNDEDKYYMINSIRHPVIHKDASATLTRVIRLCF